MMVPKSIPPLHILSGTAERIYFEPRSTEVILASLAESWKRIHRIKDDVYLINNKATKTEING